MFVRILLALEAFQHVVAAGVARFAWRQRGERFTSLARQGAETPSGAQLQNLARPKVRREA